MGYSKVKHHKDSERLDRVYQFVLENFHRSIHLSEVADLAYLGISPFCSFFKKSTHKTFSHFLNDLAGQVFVFFILTVAAAEAAIGLAILIVLFRSRRTINVDDLDSLKG